MSGLDELKYPLELVNIGLNWLIWFGSVNMSLDWLVSVWIGYYRSRLVNISLDGLNVKKYRLILVKIG